MKIYKKIIKKDSTKKLILQAIESIVKSNDPEKLKEYISDIEVQDIVFFMRRSEAALKVKFVFLADINIPCDVLVMLDNRLCSLIISVLGINKFANIANKLSGNQLLDLFRVLDKDIKIKLLPLINSKIRSDLEELMDYHNNNIESIINKDVMVVNDDDSVEFVIDLLKKDAINNNKKDFHSVFVLEKETGKVVGCINAHSLLKASPKDQVSSVMDRDFFVISCDADKHDIVSLFYDNNIDSAPVLNKNGTVVGEIALENVLSLIAQEIEDDLNKLSQSPSFADGANFLEIGFIRLPWLFANTILAIGISLLIGLFSETINSVVALAILIPIITSMSGCCSAQITVSSVRAIAFQNLNSSNFFTSLFREVKANLFLGITMASFSGAIAFLRYKDIKLVLLYIITIQSTFIISALSGVCVPFLLHLLKKDPAIAAPVVVNAISDLFAYMFFFGMTKIFII